MIIYPITKALCTADIVPLANYISLAIIKYL